MANPTDRPKERPSLETDTQADRPREPNAGRDSGGVSAADEDPRMEDGSSINAGDEDALDQSIGVQGSDQP